MASNANESGRAFALASGFSGAMGSGSAVASASTAAYADDLRVQAARRPRISRRYISRRPSLRSKSHAVYSAHNVPLNHDPHPIVIRKKPVRPVHYTQQVSVKFLQPPPAQEPGAIVITQQRDVQAAPAPPKLIRQRPPRPIKPAPLVVRERPPMPPALIPPEHHIIPGKVIPPPPRKVIVERLPQLPQPPQDIVVERWLEYAPRTRRVVFQPAPKLIPAPAPKNVLIQWDSPAVALNRQFRNLGISAAHPAQYAATFGASLVHPSAVPALARGIRPANGQRLAAEATPLPVRLVGDVGALRLVKKRSASMPVYAHASMADSAIASGSYASY